jgi:hypothetical protein
MRFNGDKFPAKLGFYVTFSFLVDFRLKCPDPRRAENGFVDAPLLGVVLYIRFDNDL